MKTTLPVKSTLVTILLGMVLLSCEKETSEPSQCSITCQNGGYTTSSCSCNCPEGYEGVYCHTSTEEEGGNNGGGNSGTPTYQNLSVTPSDQIRLCPTWTNGDRDFGGQVDVEVKITILKKSQNQIWRRVEFILEEPNPDYSTAIGHWEQKIYQAPSGWTVHEIITNTQSNWSYTDTDHSLDTGTSNNPHSPVYKIKVNGDTSGNDIGNCTTDDSYLSVYYNPIEFKIKKN